MHGATKADEFTILGDDNVLLAYAHVAHDCIIGNHLVMSAQAALAGHVIVEDHVNIGWGSGVHQFCRIGAHAMIGAMSKVVQDVPPFIIADGNAAIARSINKVGLERNEFSLERLDACHQACLPGETCSIARASNRTQAFEHMRTHKRSRRHPDFQHFLNFVTKSRARGKWRGSEDGGILKTEKS